MSRARSGPPSWRRMARTRTARSSVVSQVGCDVPSVGSGGADVGKRGGAREPPVELGHELPRLLDALQVGHEGREVEAGRRGHPLLP